MIPQETIEQVRQASDIVRVIGEYIRLKKRGRNYQALCPFHTEKTPSFSVSPDKQIYHCFGCGKGGSVITFLMEHEKLSFVEAVKLLARKAGIPIVETKSDEYRRDKIERMYYANESAVTYFQNLLNNPKYQKTLYKYLKDTRSIENDAIEYFKLGFAGEEWSGLINFAKNKDITDNELEDAGLAIKSEKSGNYFDRFRFRLMIPIMNLSGKTIAFGGRTLKKGEPAKYVNSPETPLYSKSNILYGLNFARDAVRDKNSVVIVEGYFDVISLWQVGIKNVVASSGTAFTEQQARLLARFADQVYLFFDADSAGRNAALKSVGVLYDAGLEVKIIVPPDGEDPDSLARKFGADKIEELIHDAVSFISFRITDYNRLKDGIIGREKIIKEFSTVGSKISDATRRTLFFEEAADKLGVDQSIFTVKPTTSKTPDKTSASLIKQKDNRLETEFLSLLFSNPGNLDMIFEKISPDDLDSKELSRLYSALKQQYRDIGIIEAKALIDNSTDFRFISLISEIATIDWDKDEVEQQIRLRIRQISDDKKKRQRKKLLQELAEAEAAGNQDKANQLLDEIDSLK